MSFISLRDVTKSFGSFTALEGISLDIEPAAFISIVGPSGCGKSTLLQLIGGLLTRSSGEISLKGRTIDSPQREMIYVFQQYNRSLFPWRTVINNIAFGLEGVGRDRKQVREKCQHYIDLVGLRHFEHHYPYQLSGGMQQRVAVARALVCGPDVLLMDEPFGSVDAQTRAGLQDLLLRLWREYAFTVLFVTHDTDEAVYLAEKVLVLTSSPGRIRECLPIDLPYPRHQVKTRETERYLAYRRTLYALLFPDSLYAQDVVGAPGPRG
jgi:NitT/TauT family transport system ATP-binding protein